MNKIKRRVSGLFKNFGKYFIPAIALIFSISGYLLSFLKNNPDTVYLGRFNSFNAYDIFNFTWWFLLSIFLLGIILWVWSRNARPLVSIDVHSLKNEVYLRVKNEESSDLEFIDIKFGALKLGNNEGNSIEHLGRSNEIKVEKRIINGENTSIIIASGNKGYTNFEMNSGLYNLALNDRESEKSQGKYKIAFELWVTPKGENKALFDGMYVGVIHHTFFNGSKTDSGMKVYGDTLYWEGNSIKRVNKKEYDIFVHPEKHMNKKMISQS